MNRKAYGQFDKERGASRPKDQPDHPDFKPKMMKVRGGGAAKRGLEFDAGEKPANGFE